mmetsp:Transcript_113990/g.322718  ORF Transcript_113990/g.322718 Transcript_113990/m.322718 type:complete len:284 (-) Transcript_113990:63-914(-)
MILRGSHREAPSKGRRRGQSEPSAYSTLQVKSEGQNQSKLERDHCYHCSGFMKNPPGPKSFGSSGMRAAPMPAAPTTGPHFRTGLPSFVSTTVILGSTAHTLLLPSASMEAPTRFDWGVGSLDWGDCLAGTPTRAGGLSTANFGSALGREGLPGAAKASMRCACFSSSASPLARSCSAVRAACSLRYAGSASIDSTSERTSATRRAATGSTSASFRSAVSYAFSSAWRPVGGPGGNPAPPPPWWKTARHARAARPPVAVPAPKAEARRAWPGDSWGPTAMLAL